MKKFLHLPFDSADVPSSLDRRILAAAALRANRARKFRRGVRLMLPAAAAAAAVMTGVTFYCFDTDRNIVQTDAISASEMLALADMTVLEQGNYALASMSEMDFPEENTFI